MKFIFCGYDFAIDTLMRLLDEGHTLAGILTFPCDNLFSFNNRLHALAAEKGVPITEDKPGAALIDSYLADGVELVLSIGYLHKLPAIDDSKAYGVNVHPALLPRARGLMPLPHIIMNQPEAAGMTAHKLSDAMDTGDILLQQPLSLHPQDTVETVGARIAMALPEMIAGLVTDLPAVWDKATPQDETKASTCPVPDDAMRSIDWSRPVAATLRQARAFGRMGLLFKVNEDIWVAGTINGWEEPHTHQPGDICFLSPRDIVIAAADGYICISEADKIIRN